MSDSRLEVIEKKCNGEKGADDRKGTEGNLLALHGSSAGDE